ncbi:hypothetical protein [Synechococcus sp. LTW-R]|uniref:hypothetical protein n=1 Tax=Synechococcus sp. LTW-R TaxID=2751170 RepID=UPI001625EC01|nr:hypothetical protein [Synechococcus sp. LTW-R]QNG29913.1 hypothetical protein H0O22_01650 [Synechococcus sp. LTW-R]
MSKLHHAQDLVLSHAIGTAARNAVQIPTVERVSSQLGLIFVELGHGEATTVIQTLSQISP